MKETAAKKNYDKIISFVIMGLLFLASFSFGGTNYGYLMNALAFIVAVISYAFLDIKFSKDEQKSLLIYAIPLIIYAIFGSFSQFWLNSGFSSISMSLINAMGILSFFALGILSKKIEGFKISYVIFSILCGLALIVMINTIISLSEYGFFYMARYANYERFYDGIAYTIGDEAKILNGFSAAFVSASYSYKPALLLSMALPALLFMSPKENKQNFIITAVFGGVGLLSLLLVFYKSYLLLFLFLVVIAILFRFLPHKEEAPKWEKIVGIVILSLGALYILLILINGIFEISAFNSGFLGKIFNNRFILPINQMLQGMFYQKGNSFLFLGIFGMSSSAEGYWNGSSFTSGILGNNIMFEFSALSEGGIFAFASLLALLVVVIIAARKFLFSNKENMPEKIIIAMMLLAFFFSSSIFNDVEPLKSQSTTYVSPLYQNLLFSLMIYFFGYIYMPKKDTLRKKGDLSYEE